jgi:hypothetical protein
MRVIFQECNIETITKGRSKYQIASVVYTVNGANRTQKLLSFANPESFAAVQKFAPGTTLEVTITKNDSGYDQWAKVVAADDAPAAATPITSGKITGSNYETREERTMRQLHIVRQSSLSNAIALLSPGAKTALEVNKVIEVAQELVDFVYDDGKENLAPTNTDFQDVSH